MATSIGKLSKSFFIKLLVGIIILPFVFWGMGDVFRGGNQNVIATIDSKKVSTQEFVNYLNRLNLNEEGIITTNINKNDYSTFYTKFGNVFCYILLIILVFLIIRTFAINEKKS